MAGVLVLGAAGLLGRAVVTAARATLGADAVHPLVAHRVADLPGARVLPLSDDRVGELASLLEDLEPAAVVNAAGRTTGDRAALMAANVGTVAAVLEAMRRAGSTARLVHLGSAAEYAPVAPGVPTGEESPLGPRTGYAETKAEASGLVAGAAADGLDAVIARVFNPIGAGMPPTSLPGLAARALAAAAAAGEASVELGPLAAERDYLDLRDIAAAVVVLARAPRLEHRVYNVASGRGVVVRDLVLAIAERVGFAGAIRETGPGSPRSATTDRQVADVGRLRGAGWRPAIDLAGSIDALVGGVAEPRPAAG